MPGHKVVVEIKKYEPYLKGDIVKIIGHKNDPDVDILSVVNKYDVDIDFPQADMMRLSLFLSLLIQVIFLNV